jgi:hypothetical protein
MFTVTLEQEKILNEQLTNDILSEINNWKGNQSVSFLMTSLRQKGWRLAGNMCDFERTCVELGFSVVRINKCGKVVTL